MKNLMARFIGILILGILAASCDHEHASDVRQLLSTVPADASMVSTLSVTRAVESAGAGVKENKVVLTAAQLSALNSLGEKRRGQLQAIVNGESGVELTSLVFFTSGYNTYCTGIVEHPKQFGEFVAKLGMKAPDTSGSLSYGPEIAYNDCQFWLCMDGTVQPGNITRFMTLSEKESFLSVEYAEKMIASTHSAELFATVRWIVKQSLPEGSSAVPAVNMALQTAFKDAAYVAGPFDLKGSAVSCSFSVLDASFHPAECTLPFRPVDTKAVASLGCTGSAVVAAGLTPELVAKVVEMASRFAPGLKPEALSSVDGTFAAVAGEEGEFKASVQTAHDNGALADLLGGVAAYAGASVSLAPSSITVASAALPSGPVDPAKVADSFKGAYIAGAFTARPLASRGVERPVILLVVPDGKSLKFKVEAADLNYSKMLEE